MRWVRASAVVGVLSLGACELFFPFDVAVDGGADAQLDVAPKDATTDAHADADASLPDVAVATTLYSFVGKGAGLAVDSQNLYWFLTRDAGPSLMVTNKADGGTRLLFADAGINATGIALDDARVYWVTFATASAPNGGSVFSVGKDGGAFQDLVTLPDWWPANLAVDDTNVYVINPQPTAEPLVARVAKDGGVLVALEPAVFDAGSNNASAETIAVDDASVYRVHLSVIAGYPKSCSLEAGTCNPQALVNENPGPTCIHAIAVDDGGLYWVQATAGGTCKFSCGMYRTGKGGGSVTSLYVTSSACGNFIALDEDSVYTLSTINDELYFAARDGGGGALTPVQSNPAAAPVVADGVGVYWLDNNTTGGGEIMKLLR